MTLHDLPRYRRNTRELYYAMRVGQDREELTRQAEFLDGLGVDAELDGETGLRILLDGVWRTPWLASGDVITFRERDGETPSVITYRAADFAKRYVRDLQDPPPRTLEQLMERAAAHARNAGFRDEPRPFSTDIALIHSEVSEAAECLNTGIRLNRTIYAADGKPEGFPSEIADVLIRIYETCFHCEIPLEAALRRLLGVKASDKLSPKGLQHRAFRDRHKVLDGIRTPKAFLLNLHTALTTILEAERTQRMGSGHDYVASLFAVIVARCYRQCVADGIDLCAAVDEKMAYNETRSRMHGGKKY